MAFDLKKLSAREKNLVGILLIVAASLPFFLLTIPAWKEYVNSKSRTNEYKSKLSSLEAHIKRLEKLKKENLELSKKTEAQKLYLAKTHEIDFLVQDLKNICDESAVSLESFTPTNAEPINIILEKQAEEELHGGQPAGQKLKQTREKLKGQDLPIDLYKFPIEVKINGNFTEILELFKNLEKYGRVISVDNISLGKVEGKQFGDRLSKAKKKETPTSSLFGNFDLIAYSLAKENETLPFSSLQRAVPQTFKYKKKTR